MRSVEWALMRAKDYQLVDANTEIVLILAAEVNRLREVTSHLPPEYRTKIMQADQCVSITIPAFLK